MRQAGSWRWVAILMAAIAWSVPARGAPRESWTGALGIRACARAALEMPRETEEALRATLLVKAGEAVGSAVIISPDGFALTAAHVVNDAANVTVLTDRKAELKATLVRIDEQKDVALLHVQFPVDAPCLVPAGGNVSIGADIFVLGSPGGEDLAFSVSKGIVSGHRELSGERFVQLDASVNPGNSGGPVLDEVGHIVGLASWKVSHVSMEGLAFATPIDVAVRALEISFGDRTDSNWAERRGRRRVKREVRTTSPPTPRDKGRRPRPSKRVARPAPTARRSGLSDGQIGLIVPGAVVSAIGLASILGSAGGYWASDEMSKGTWDALVGVNVFGWVAAGTGAALLGSGLIWFAADTPDDSAVGFVAGPSGVIAVGRF